MFFVGDCEVVIVIFDVLELVDGIYEGLIIINSNDLDQLMVIILVMLIVNGMLELSIFINDFDFGEV